MEKQILDDIESDKSKGVVTVAINTDLKRKIDQSCRAVLGIMKGSKF